MSPHLVIVFAYHFPPENAIGALRPFRFCKYLSRQGYRCHVISAADLAGNAEGEGSFIADPFVTGPGGDFKWHLARAIRRFLLPGLTGFQWSLLAYKAALKLVTENRSSRITIFSTSPPVSTHLAAYLLRRHAKLPWIADCRDPVADNPASGKMHRVTRRIYQILEKIVVTTADCTIANTDSAEAKLKKSYPRLARRIQLIWNGFDPEERLTPFPATSSDRRILAHVGDLYGGRTVRPILESLRRLIDRRYLDSKTFQVFLVGPAAEESLPDKDFMSAAMEEGWLKRAPERVPQAAAHQIICSADLLLLAQPQSALQVPGKLFDYLQIGRPILAFVPPDSPVERVLENSGIPYICIYSTDSAEDQDRAILAFFKIKIAQARPSDWFEERFNAKNHAGKIAQLIEELTPVANLVPAVKEQQLEDPVL